MKIIIEITEAQALGLGYLAGIDCRSRKNYIETTLKKHIYEKMHLIPMATKIEMANCDGVGSAQGEA
jgi:hypothetical protein